MYIFTPQFTPTYFFYYFPLVQQDLQTTNTTLSLPQPPLPQQNEPFNESLQKIIVTRDDLLLQGYETTKRAWTQQEDKILLHLCSKQNACFEQIAKKLEGRNGKMCYSRYRRLCNQSKDCWTKAENEKLKNLVQEYGQKQWKSFVEYFPNRNHKQLKDHYDNYLRSNLANYQWTLQQDLELIQLANQYGKNWKIIQAKMPHRSRNQIKNRFFGRILRLNSRKLTEKAQQSRLQPSQAEQFNQ